MVNEARFFKSVLFLLSILFKFIVIEAPPAESFRHMHIHNSPRSKNSFFVGILEMTEYLRYLNNTSCRCFPVGGCRKPSDTLTCRNKYISVIILSELGKYLFTYTCRHKFFPRFIINNINKTVNIDIFLNRDIRTVNHKWHTNRNTTQDINSLFACFFSLFLFLAFFLLFLCQILWRCRRLGVVYMLNLFISQALSVDNNIFLFLGCFGRSDNILKLIKFRSIDFVKLEKFVIIKRFVLKTAIYRTLGINLLYLFHHRLNAVCSCLRAGNSNNRAVIEKFGHCFSAFLLALSRLTG